VNNTGQQPSAVGRICLGAVKGILLPFLLVFVLVVDIGLNSLLGIKNSSPQHSWMASLFPGNAGLKLALAALVAVFSVVIGALAGSAIGHNRGALIGAGLGYLIGSMTGGALIELLAGRRRASRTERSGHVQSGANAFVRDAFRFNYPKQWKVDDKDEDYDPDHMFLINTPGSSMMIFAIYETERDLRDVIDAKVEGHRKNIHGASRSKLENWGRYAGRGAILRGKFQGVKRTTVRLFAFHAVGKTFTVTEYAPDDEESSYAHGFQTIEDSFEVLD
jgi:hypothetical protein